MTRVPRDRLWQEAASFAARSHVGQTRKDCVTPYAAHTTRVALTVAARFGCGDPETLAIALLHDTIEDCTVDYEDLEKRFGAVVADGVVALTNDAALPRAERDRHAEARLRAGCWRAKLVKLADVLDNATDLPEGDGDHSRRKRIRRRSAWVIDAARTHEPSPALDQAAEGHAADNHAQPGAEQAAQTATLHNAIAIVEDFLRSF